MIINKLSVNNFGPYRGYIEFDLSSSESNGSVKSVLLFGGKNGAGKTNLFEAVNLCLYGPLSIGRGTSRKEYEDYLLDKIHRNGTSDKPLDEASVSLEFTHAHVGTLDTYFINRHWKRNGHGIIEDIDVRKNGEPFKNLSQDQWDTFIKELIPPIIAQIFFFDGEKVRRLSGDRTSDNIYLADSIKALLGIDLTERLRDDLLIYQKKYIAENPAEISYVTERLQLQDQKKDLENHLSNLRQDRAGIESNIIGSTTQIKKIEDKLASLGGEFYAKRDEQKAEEYGLKTEVEELQKRITELCHHLYPFSLCKQLCNQLQSRIEQEQADLKVQSTSQYAKEILDEVINNVNKSCLANPSEYHFYFQEFTKLLVDKRNELLNVEGSTNNISIINELSANETEKILIWINEALTDVPIKMKSLSGELRKRRDRLYEIEKDLARTPTEEVLKPVIEELNSRNQDLGAYRQSAVKLDETISGAEYQVLQLDRKLKKYDQEAVESNKLSEKIKIIAGTQEVLRVFADSLRHKKIITLEEEILSLFNKLCRKEDLISKINVNPENMTIEILDSNGKKITKKSLSSGERQIFAISILWALKKISNRPIPVIIDTPLSRLDSDHRKSLIKSFFPMVSHQTIILSTDTEINRGYFKDLSDYISNTYHLRFDKKEKRTIVEQGYFKQGI